MSSTPSNKKTKRNQIFKERNSIRKPLSSSEKENEIKDSIVVEALKLQIFQLKKKLIELEKKPEKKECFSSFKNLRVVLMKYNLGTELCQLPNFEPKKNNVDDNNKYFIHCINDIKLKLQGFGPAVGKNEAVRREYVSSILLAAVSLVPGARLDAERVVEGDDIGGRIDYGILKDDELICISEVKESDMKEGIAMNIVQLDSSLQENNRKRKQKKELNYTYGIVTTGTTWLYIMFADGRKNVYTTANTSDDTIPLGNDVLRDDSELRKCVKKVIEKITWMLNVKVSVNGELVTKKQCVQNNTKKSL